MPDTNKKRGRKLRRRKRDRRGGEKKVGDPLMDDLGNYLRTFPCYLLFSLRKCTKQHTLRDPFCPLFPLASSSRDSFSYRLFLPVIFVSHGRGQDGWGTIGVVTTSPCFPIKNNRRTFFLTVAGEIISSDPFSRSIFVASQSRWERKKEGAIVSLFTFRKICLPLNHKPMWTL